MSYRRLDKRTPQTLRPVKITRRYIKHAEGSVLIEAGDTRIVCAASVEERVPFFKRDSGSGWVTAEYAMLPRATKERNNREIFSRKGRSQEIQRLIGRSLRAVVDLDLLGERTIVLDADVIQADGGTRTWAITGAFIALYDACSFLLKEGKIKKLPIKEFLSAVSIGIVQGSALVDLDYAEDSMAEVDMNVVGTESDKFVEIQGTAEGLPFSKKALDTLIDLAGQKIKEVIKIQKEALEK